MGTPDTFDPDAEARNERHGAGTAMLADASRVALDNRTRAIMEERGIDDYSEAVQLAAREFDEAGVTLDAGQSYVDVVSSPPELRDQMHRRLHMAALRLMHAHGLTYAVAVDQAAASGDFVNAQVTELSGPRLPWRDLGPREKPALPWSDDDWEIDSRRAAFAGVSLDRDGWAAATEAGIDPVADALHVIRDAVLDEHAAAAAARHEARDEQRRRDVAEAEAKAAAAATKSAADAKQRRVDTARQRAGLVFDPSSVR